MVDILILIKNGFSQGPVRRQLAADQLAVATRPVPGFAGCAQMNRMIFTGWICLVAPDTAIRVAAISSGHDAGGKHLI